MDYWECGTKKLENPLYFKGSDFNAMPSHPLLFYVQAPRSPLLKSSLC